jgi:NMD protein affecting ribosome stability and mRNA decay
MGPSGTTCSRCGAVYYNKRWYASASDLPEKPQTIALPSNLLCPGCQRVRDRHPEGYVSFSGRFLHEHREEIVNLIQRELEKAKGFNPLEQVIQWEETSGGFQITTTTKKLAQRIGRAVQKAYDGKIEIKRSERNELFRVFWVRER